MLPLVYRSPLRRTLLYSAIRYNSSVPAKPRTRFASHLLAGFAGAILGAGATGYTWYYFSGVRKTVDRIQGAILYLDQARDNLSKQNKPSRVLWLLRQAVKSYLAFPGSNFVVDQVFDVVDSQVDAHADKANAVIATAYTQIRDLIQDRGKTHTVQVLAVLRNLMKELQPKGLELKEMAEKYEVERRVNEGFAAATTVTKAKIQDSRLFSQLQQKIERRKPVDNNDASLDLPQPAVDTTPSDDEGS